MRMNGEFFQIVPDPRGGHRIVADNGLGIGHHLTGLLFGQETRELTLTEAESSLIEIGRALTAQNKKFHRRKWQLKSLDPRDGKEVQHTAIVFPRPFRTV